MIWSQLIAIFATIVVVAGVGLVVGSPNTAKIISAFGSTFSGSLRAALGK